MVLATGKGIAEYIHVTGHYLYGLAQSLGGPGLFLVALADSSFLSVPEGNDLLIVVLSTGESWRVMSYYVLMTVFGSVVGCSILYGVGRRGGRYIERRQRREKLERVRSTYQKWGLWAVLVPSILPPPTPFKAFVLSAGMFSVPFKKFLVAVLVGRSIRYSMWGILAVLYGELARDFLEEHVTNVGLVLLGLIILGSLGYVGWRKIVGNPRPRELT